ncbi:T9SS type A sorting domain-containing protein [Cloacibacterium sp.]|uniref:T9SS type A sorting domain-containing protein n=1 Tax=Cloacibacterium sp. TaxID=1913682 RepID=UPI003C78881D
MITAITFAQTVTTFSSSNELAGPKGITIDTSNNLYVVNGSGSNILQISPAGFVSVFAGCLSCTGNTDGFGTWARFNSPTGIAIDSNNNLYVADTGNHIIRKITPAGNVTTIAGSGVAGNTDGTGTSAKFSAPRGIAIDNNDNLYVTDYNNHRIRKITPTGNVTTFAGSTNGQIDGQGTAAKFSYPSGITIDGNGNLYVTDINTIKVISPTGYVSTLSGNYAYDYIDGVGTSARFNMPLAIFADSNGDLLISDSNNNRIRKLTLSSSVVSTFAGNGTAGDVNGTTLNSSFFTPYGITKNSTGDIFIADYFNSKIKKISNTNLAIQDNELKLKISIYPNPASEKISVKSEIAISKIELYDLSGKKLKESTLKEMNISTLPRGNYLLKISDKNGNTETQKLIKK